MSQQENLYSVKNNSCQVHDVEQAIECRKKNENNNETKMTKKKEWQTKENCHFYHTVFIANELLSIDFSQWNFFFFVHSF